MSSLKAVIFDMDGLLIDSEELWTEARNEVLQQYGATYSKEDKEKFIGRDYREGIEFLINRDNLPLSFENFAENEQSILDVLFGTKLKFMPGAENLLSQLESGGIKRAIATGSPRRRLDSALKKLNMVFDASVAGDEIGHGKPEPEIFLKAAELMSVKPESCAVLEDSPYGIEAARRGVMKSVGVYDSRFTEREDFTNERKPDLLTDSLEKIGVDDLQNLF